MDLQFTEEQQLLRATLRDVLERHSSPDHIRQLEDGPDGFSRDLWRELVAMDVVGLSLPEPAGGSGMGAMEIVVLYEELGRALASTPHLATAVLGASLLRGEPGWLERIARGDVILTCAWYEPQRSDGLDALQLTAKPDGDRYRLSGTKVRVPMAAAADAHLVLAWSDDGIGAFLVDGSDAGIAMTQTLVLGSDAEYEVAYTNADALRVADRAVVEDAMVDLWIAVAAWAIGGARRALEMTVEYASSREQFGKPIGAFQGLAHPIADMATEITGAEVLLHQAAWRRAHGLDLGPLAAMAKYYACDVFKRMTKVAQQVFGGVGFTTVIDIQLYFRRAKQLELTWTGPARLEEILAAAELDAERGYVSIDAGV
jgi:alkylation response protein AidB-like acyl-CoA dehydrogenase